MSSTDPPPPADPAPRPRANPELFGHEAAEAELGRLARAARLPHAILITGPRGIGKATLAFRLARFLLAQDRPDEAAASGTGAAPAGRGLAIDPESGTFRRVAAGAHADLLTIERAWDPRRRRLRADIVVADTREIASFFRLTAAEEGWRIVIVDGAEEMNRHAANALLKILEEPPERSLLLLVSHNPGRLLPTVRSRCRRLVLAPAPAPLATRLLRRWRPQLDETAAASLLTLSNGSIGRALELAETGGLDLYRALIELLAAAPPLDATRLHALTDRLARPDAEDAYRVSEELLSDLLARLAAGAVGRATATGIFATEEAAVEGLASRADPGRWAELHATISADFLTARELNLDRKQTLLGAFFAIGDAVC
jgi:DNA polymerase III subunit delta'